eukprot:14497945-Alexandrium_andersonii.AAC.1
MPEAMLPSVGVVAARTTRQLRLMAEGGPVRARRDGAGLKPAESGRLTVIHGCRHLARRGHVQHAQVLQRLTWPAEDARHRHQMRAVD